MKHLKNPFPFTKPFLLIFLGLFYYRMLLLGVTPSTINQPSSVPTIGMEDSDLLTHYERLFIEALETTNELNQTKLELIHNVQAQQEELLDLNQSLHESSIKIGLLKDKILSHESILKEEAFRINQLSKQHDLVATSYAEKVQLETSLESQYKNLIQIKDTYELESVSFSKKIEELRDIKLTPHTPSWHYTSSHGWFWSSPENFPMVYSHKLKSWLYYEIGTSYPWSYYNYANSQWKNLNFE